MTEFYELPPHEADDEDHKRPDRLRGQKNAAKAALNALVVENPALLSDRLKGARELFMRSMK